MKKHTPKINPDLKIREYIDDAKMTAAQIVHDIEALNQIKSVICSALEDVEQQISIAQNAFMESSFLSQMREPDDDPLPVDTQFLNYQINDDQVIDETDQ
tara:strand:- start:702 stop:1001 length:300 start_codon:yes stop_codon:yes gene_type:complete